MSPTNRDLAALKRYLLGDELRRVNLQKMNYFTKTAVSLPGVPDWLGDAVFVSFDMEWYSEWRKDLGSAPPTELGFAVIYGEDIIEFINNPADSLENLFAHIRAFHVRVIERCHMMNRLNGCADNTEENFLFDTTSFLTEEQVKAVVADMFNESTYQTAGERRPLILIDQGFHDEIKLVRKNYGIDIHNTDVVDMIQARYVALDAGIVGPTDPKGLKPLTQGFGLGTAESWYLHNAGNDAVVTLIVALLAGLNDTLHPFAPSAGYPPHTVEGRNIQDIVRAAADRIKSRYSPIVKVNETAMLQAPASFHHIFRHGTFSPRQAMPTIINTISTALPHLRLSGIHCDTLNKPIRTTATLIALPEHTLGAGPHTGAVIMSSSSHSYNRIAVRLPLEGKIFHWRCTIGDCQYINQTQNTQFDFDFACKSCGAATGKEVCLLQLTLVNSEEKLEELVKELYGIGPPPDPTISRVMVAGDQS
ncbi:hypothetical protein N0V87_008452 [Didymella glomerata]|uniref:Gfd2/YDR514C-like C-terminal domain-containing protein n=1 Tax=Didymella glomerata TaxID=749621 RepID=A0A9W9BX33_9PLEO|nr:hypothetical protein N0V87_008452 [Didymella glomerata]